MKILKKTLASVALAAAAVASAHAAPVNVAGVSFETGAFEAAYTFTQWFAGAELTGVGEFYSINGMFTSVNNNAMSEFAPGKELTFRFGGFVSDGLGGFGNGWLRVYVDSTPDYNTTTLANRTNVARATDGDLWLSLTAVGNQFVSSSLDPSNPYAAGALFVNWAVNTAESGGGLAGSIFDTNTFGTSGFDLTSDASGAFGANGYATSNGNIQALVAEVPEPASLALVGLGLLGLAVRRRQSAK